MGGSIMKGFLREDYFLNNNISYMLYKEFAENKPIIDYHCHLSAREIYENKPFESLYQLWLKYDHYKWRLMRQAGIDEYLLREKPTSLKNSKVIARRFRERSIILYIFGLTLNCGNISA